jgi:nucleolar protein 53
MPVIKPLAAASDRPKQYKQPSRKGKGAWRKNIDLTEITEGLEELNKQVIAG